ncbi:MAG: hypothetical protein U1F70_01335 [Candidatus Competibacteraceae bacterium]
MTRYFVLLIRNCAYLATQFRLSPFAFLTMQMTFGNRILVVFGIHPEVIKLAPVVKALQRARTFDVRVIVLEESDAALCCMPIDARARKVAERLGIETYGDSTEVEAL